MLPPHPLSFYPCLPPAWEGGLLGWGLHEALGAGEPVLLGTGGMRSSVGKDPQSPYTHSARQPHLVKLLEPAARLLLSSVTQWA